VVRDGRGNHRLCNVRRPDLNICKQIGKKKLKTRLIVRLRMNKLTIDFDKLKDIALRGIRRTSIFLALGVNAARDERLKKYHLTDLSMFRFVPDNVDTQTLRHFKSAFEQWIISNGLRELVESFATFMDGVYRICLIIGVNKEKVSSNNVNSNRKKIEKKGRSFPLVRRRSSTLVV